MDIFLHNGTIKPSNEAVASLYSVELSYGFGVYENIRVKGGQARYTDEHAARLMQSARAIGLEHQFTPQQIKQYVQKLTDEVTEPAYNLKLLLIGAAQPEEVDFYILPLSPRFPDRKLYKTGAKAITVEYERYMPNAKTLNMLPSYLAYRDAQKAGAYDALLVNRNGEMVEGTRTNLFAIRGATLVTPPADEVLVGVTRTHVIKTARQQNFEIIEQPLPLKDIEKYDSFFVTSTSSKIMPLASIDDYSLSISDELRSLMQAFSAA